MRASIAAELHKRYFTYDQALKAAEEWSDRTKKAKSFRQLIAIQSKFELALRKHFKAQSQDTDQFVNWAAYAVTVVSQANTAAENDDPTQNIVVDIQGAGFLTEQQLLLAIMQGYILSGIGLGIDDAQELYVDAGLSKTSESVQKAALERSSQHVTSITETTRAKIQQSIATSLKLGEPVQDATKRVSDIIDDPDRAEMIARTETRNAYVDGQGQVAATTGAISKQWDGSSNPCPICQENIDAGTIDINDDFPNGDDPHPNCLCGAPIYNYPSGDSSSGDADQS